MAEKIINKIPKGYRIWVKTIGKDKSVFLTAANAERTQYYLYKMVDGGFQLITKAKTPSNFDQLINKLSEA